MFERSASTRNECAGPARWLILALCCTGLISARVAIAGEDRASEILRPATPIPERSVLDDRVEALSKALVLDAKQQSELRIVLEDQRRQIEQVWSDTSVPASYRIGATKAVSDRTAERIRMILNDEQKKNYNPSRPAHDPPKDSKRPRVEDWMRAATPSEASRSMTASTAPE